jgi:hypothetical protein
MTYKRKPIRERTLCESLSNYEALAGIVHFKARAIKQRGAVHIQTNKESIATRICKSKIQNSDKAV